MPNANILIIEEDDRVAQKIMRCLKRAHYTTGCCSTGEEAISIVQMHVYHAIVVGSLLPSGVGPFDTVKTIRTRFRQRRITKTDRQIGKMPILMLTNTGPKERSLAFHAGANDAMDHAFDEDELVLRIQRLIRDHAFWYLEGMDDAFHAARDRVA